MNNPSWRRRKLGNKWVQCSQTNKDREIFVLQASWAIGQWLNYQQIIRYCMYNLLLHHKSSISLPTINCKQLVAAKDSYFWHLYVLSIQEQRLCSCNSAGWWELPIWCLSFSVLTRALWPEDYFNICIMRIFLSFCMLCNCLALWYYVNIS
jgi:hypothetical protein